MRGVEKFAIMGCMTVSLAEPIQLPVERRPQPDDVTCGPTSLWQVYRYYGLDVELEEVIAETPRNPDGGTLAIYLGLAALKRGFRPTLYPYSLQVFDPTWKNLPKGALLDKLRRRSERMRERPRLSRVLGAWIELLERGGSIEFREFSRDLLVGLLSEGRPILTGLSATYLYQTPRELGPDYDDVGGDPVGHFVVVSGYDPTHDELVVCDPSTHIPFEHRAGRYPVKTDRLIRSILLGLYTYDAVLMVLEPPAASTAAS